MRGGFFNASAYQLTQVAPLRNLLKINYHERNFRNKVHFSALKIVRKPVELLY